MSNQDRNRDRNQNPKCKIGDQLLHMSKIKKGAEATGPFLTCKVLADQNLGQFNFFAFGSVGFLI